MDNAKKANTEPAAGALLPCGTELVAMFQPLGATYKDTNTGAVGKCTAMTEYVTGYRAVQLSGVDSTGRPMDWWVDVQALELQAHKDGPNLGQD